MEAAEVQQKYQAEKADPSSKQRLFDGNPPRRRPQQSDSQSGFGAAQSHC
jgi:hypothetical protein